MTLLAFLFVHSIPGGPFDTGAVRPAATTAALKAHYHLDKPLPIQYLLYMKGVLDGRPRRIDRPAWSSRLDDPHAAVPDIGGARNNGAFRRPRRRDSGRPDRRREAQPTPRPPGDGRSHDRLRDPQLHPLDPLHPGHRAPLSPPAAWRLGTPVTDRSPRPGTRTSVGELRRPSDARERHRDAAEGLHPDCPRQGRRPAASNPPPRVAERAPADHDGHRPS